MAENTKIEWAHHTWNPWRGCEQATLPDGSIHPGCVNCYAMAMAPRNPDILGVWGPNGTRVLAVTKTFEAPLRWNKRAKENGIRERVFVNSLSDVFEAWTGYISANDGQVWTKPYSDSESQIENWVSCDVETMQRDPQGWRFVDLHDVRREVFNVIDQCDWLDFLILTKRPDNVRRMWPRYTYDACATGDCPHDRQSECRVELYRENVWLLTSISDQQSADAMIPPLLECRDLVPVLGVSAEPLVGPIDLEPYIMTYVTDGGDVGYMARPRKPFIDWVIVGGESGPHARPMHPAWARSLRDQCQAAGVPFFMKQMGGTKKPFAEIPEDLFIREFPNA